MTAKTKTEPTIEEKLAMQLQRAEERARFARIALRKELVATMRCVESTIAAMDAGYAPATSSSGQLTAFAGADDAQTYLREINEYTNIAAELTGIAHLPSAERDAIVAELKEYKKANGESVSAVAAMSDINLRIEFNSYHTEGK